MMVEALRREDAEPFMDEVVPYEEWLAILDVGLNLFPRQTTGVLKIVVLAHVDRPSLQCDSLLGRAETLNTRFLKSLLRKEEDSDTGRPRGPR